MRPHGFFHVDSGTYGGPLFAITDRMREFGVEARTVIVSALLCAGAMAGCMGDIGGDAPGTVPPKDPAVCDAGPGRVGLQRLTRAEYNRTVRDLFGVTSAPADAFPPDSTTEGFDNIAASLTTSPQLAKLLLDSAETVASDALTNNKDALVSCDPAVIGDEACARETLTALALRVYRRPATEQEIDDLMELVSFAAQEGDSFDNGIEYAITAMLIAPQFLYRGVPIKVQSSGAVVPLDDYALATRLSYFMWGSTPDDTLIARAGEGALGDPELLRAEFDRMLADPKSDALYDSFVSQWLQLGRLWNADPDPALFPQFDEELRQAMFDETRLFFEDLRARDGSALEFLTGNQTYANEGLADIYGIAGVTGSELVPVTTDPD